MTSRPGRPTGFDDWLPRGTELPRQAQRKQAAQAWLPESEEEPAAPSRPARITRPPTRLLPIPEAAPAERAGELADLERRVEDTLERMEAGRLAIHEAAEAAARSAERAGTAAARSEAARERAREAEEEVARLRQELAEQSERVSQQQQALDRLQADLVPSGAQAQPPPAQPSPMPASVPEGEYFDLNAVSFHQLRDFGLSKTQASRFVARREGGGPFTSVDQLDELRGFPRDLLQRLKAHARLSG